MQATLDEYETGVQVLQVELLRAAAPSAVIEAFNDVVNAGQDAETADQQRQPRNRDASSTRRRPIASASSAKRPVKRERFIAVYAEYRAAPQVTRDRLYLETMERVYQRGNLIILDQRGGAVPYLPLDGMIRRNAPAATQGGARPMTAQSALHASASRSLLLVVLLNSMFIVRQDRQAIVLRFGAYTRTINAPGTDEPGLYFKMPFVRHRRHLRPPQHRPDARRPADRRRPTRSV